MTEPDPLNHRSRAAVDAGYVVRTPVPADARGLAEVQVAVWQEAYVGMVAQDYLDSLTVESSVELWTELLGDDSPRPATRYVAVACDGSIVGIAASGASRSATVVEPEELYDLQVLADHRGTGVADLLMQRTISSRSAELWVLEGNARAHAFYRRHGFEMNGDLDRLPELGITELRMVRR